MSTHFSFENLTHWGCSTSFLQTSAKLPTCILLWVLCAVCLQVTLHRPEVFACSYIPSKTLRASCLRKTVREDSVWNWSSIGCEGSTLPEESSPQNRIFFAWQTKYGNRLTDQRTETRRNVVCIVLFHFQETNMAQLIRNGTERWEFRSAPEAGPKVRASPSPIFRNGFCLWTIGTFTPHGQRKKNWQKLLSIISKVASQFRKFSRNSPLHAFVTKTCEVVLRHCLGIFHACSLPVSLPVSLHTSPCCFSLPLCSLSSLSAPPLFLDLPICKSEPYYYAHGNRVNVIVGKKKCLLQKFTPSSL